MTPRRQYFPLLIAATLVAMIKIGLISQTAPPFAHFNPRFEVAELPGGAAGNSVQDMAVDRYGFLWLGSQAGLHRYDGRNFTTFTHEPTNPNSLAGNFIESIFIDKKGHLWLGHMGAGLTRFDPVTNTFTRFLPTAGDTVLANQLEVRGMVEDSASYIWAGSFGEGLYWLNPATKTDQPEASFLNFAVPETNNQQQLSSWKELNNEQPTNAQLLLIEDNPELSQYLQLVLGPKFQLLTATNGEEGIEMAIEHVPDLILSDVMMPVKDGFVVCHTLKKDFRTCHIPIVLLTARADTASRITGLEQGADAYLTKPFNQRELFACLRNLFIQREKLRIKYAAQPTDGEPAPTPGMDELFLLKVRSILEENYADENFGIENLYTALGISRVQLHRKLTALTGQSASQYIRSFRLEKARELLTTTLQSVSEIAFETGFTDPNYFSRVFAQEYGMPPSDLRKGQENKAGN